MQLDGMLCTGEEEQGRCRTASGTVSLDEAQDKRYFYRWASSRVHEAHGGYCCSIVGTLRIGEQPPSIRYGEATQPRKASAGAHAMFSLTGLDYALTLQDVEDGVAISLQGGAPVMRRYDGTGPGAGAQAVQEAVNEIMWSLFRGETPRGR